MPSSSTSSQAPSPRHSLSHHHLAQFQQMPLQMQQPVTPINNNTNNSSNNNINGTPPRYNPYMPHSPLNYVHNEDEQAVRIALLISEQEAEFGVNMYQVVTEEDELEIQALLNRGFSVDEAVLWIFEKRGFKTKNASSGAAEPAEKQLSERISKELSTRKQQENAQTEVNYYSTSVLFFFVYFVFFRMTIILQKKKKPMITMRDHRFRRPLRKRKFFSENLPLIAFALCLV
jgi:hypothetical protein